MRIRQQQAIENKTKRTPFQGISVQIMTQDLIIGDCLEVLPKIESDSVDLIVTDPPYGLKFMGKDWDKAVPKIDVWEQCFRVLKDGSFMFVMSSPRQDVQTQMIMRIGSVGFNVGFTPIYWAYASGFPKAMNISKMVDKRNGTEFETKPSSGVGFMNTNDDGYHTTKNQMKRIGEMSPQAKALDGSYGGFQPKPAVEIILVCMKPLSEKTYVDQALNNHKGITWLDDCRVPYESDENVIPFQYKKRSTNVYGESERKDLPEDRKINPQGRFPANLLVSDDVLNDGNLDKRTDTGIGIKIGRSPNLGRHGIYGKSGIVDGVNYTDSGSFSRYFDLDKWYNDRILKLPKNVKKTFPFLIVPKASKSEKNEGLIDLPTVKSGSLKMRQDGSLDGQIPMGKNFHPTVKPLKLMSYLITLGSRPNDTVLDPFVGSGTTMIACKKLRRNSIGIEISNEYLEIAKKRLGHIPDPLDKFLKKIKLKQTIREITVKETIREAEVDAWDIWKTRIDKAIMV